MTLKIEQPAGLAADLHKLDGPGLTDWLLETNELHLVATLN